MPRFDTTAPVGVDVTLDVGAVHVIADGAGAAAVTVNPADPERAADVQAADRAEVELVDDRLVVRTSETRRLGTLVGPNARTGAVDVVLEVPEGVALHVTGHVVAVRVDGPIGAARIRTGVGAIHLDRTADVSARTGSGDVTVADIDGGGKLHGAGTIRVGAARGSLEVKNQHGPIEIGAATGSVRLRSAVGDVTVDTVGGEVDARTSAGSITIARAVSGTLDLRTATGDVRVGVPEGTSVHLDATTRFGRIDRQLSASDGPADGDRRAAITAHTGAGDVLLHRA